MRIGKNPFKGSRSDLRRPRRITCCAIACVPELAGYWKDFRRVFFLSIASMRENTGIDFDLIVFDNGSCEEFNDFLQDLRRRGYIDILVSANENYGKVGALNHLFGLAQGELIVFSDGDIYFMPGWLEEHLRLYDAFRRHGLRVGMITGRALPHCDCDTIIQRSGADRVPDIEIESYAIPQEQLRQHALDIGKDPDRPFSLQWHPQGKILRTGDVAAYVCAAHLQYMMPRDVAREVFPLPVHDLLSGRNDRLLDERVTELGCLKLSPLEPFIRHIGNRLDSELEREYERLSASLRQAGRDSRRTGARLTLSDRLRYYWKYLKNMVRLLWISRRP